MHFVFLYKKVAKYSSNIEVIPIFLWQILKLYYEINAELCQTKSYFLDWLRNFNNFLYY